MSVTPGTGTVPLRVLRAKVISGTDAASLTTALNTFFTSAQDSSQVVAMFHTAAFEVVVVFA